MNPQLRSICLLALMGALLITQSGASCSDTDTSRDDDLSSSTRLPRDAREVANGRGELSHTARSDGRVYLYDLDSRTVIDTRTLRVGQRYFVNTERNRIWVGEDRVTGRDINEKHDHRIYFLAGDDRDDLDTLSSDLPRSARSVAQGAGQIDYRVRDRGRIYIYDADDQRVIMSREVYPNQLVEVDPERDRVLIDGKKVYDRNLERKHAHRI